MTVLHEILEWSKSRYPWQREALRRLVVGGELSNEDVQELGEFCKAAHGLAEPRRRVVSAFVATAFAQEDADSAKVQWRQVADQLRPKVPKLAVLMDEAEHDVLAYMSFPREHRQKLHSTNPIERLHAEVKRRTNVVGIFSNEAAITRLVGAILLEQNDEWAVSRRYMTLESIAPLSDGVPITLPTVAA